MSWPQLTNAGKNWNIAESLFGFDAAILAALSVLVEAVYRMFSQIVMAEQVGQRVNVAWILLQGKWAKALSQRFELTMPGI
jgi:hypothetical protein